MAAHRPRRPAASRGRGGGWHLTQAVRPSPAPVARNLTWRPPAPRPPSKNLTWRPPPPEAAAAPAEPASSVAAGPVPPTKPTPAVGSNYVASPRHRALFRVDPIASSTAVTRPVPKAARTQAKARKATLMVRRSGHHLSLVRASPSLLAAYLRCPLPPPPPPLPRRRRGRSPWWDPHHRLYVPWWMRPLPPAPPAPGPAVRPPVPRWSPIKAGKPIVRHRQLVLRPMTYVEWPKRTAQAVLLI